MGTQVPSIHSAPDAQDQGHSHFHSRPPSAALCQSLEEQRGKLRP